MRRLPTRNLVVTWPLQANVPGMPLRSIVPEVVNAYGRLRSVPGLTLALTPATGRLDGCVISTPSAPTVEATLPCSATIR